ncbi:glyoxalase superfamily protein [Deinococcus humi]|uniref:Glyoxalase-related protein domain-containing protein n=1 Tax=Deinococcus humi TaxID=662880 RepID=A0A7W8JTV1_9DEIO|nr:glyoxalase superfamily protein [Deinococcus humi]MBB5363064.1 hypothetical protein [Deinococcus humi]GGO24892.1 hypothetical protein GCM10008949_14210 [Deinococcus humi]
MNSDPQSVRDVKARARAIHDELKRQGHADVAYGNCLHQVAVQDGYRNWHTYSAKLRADAGLSKVKRTA